MSHYCQECGNSGERGQFGVLDCAALNCTAATERAALDAHLLAIGRLHERDVAWEAYKLGQAKAVPAGFALVPIKPTDDMVQAGACALPAYYVAYAELVYRTMVEAAAPANNNTEKADDR